MKWAVRLYEEHNLFDRKHCPLKDDSVKRTNFIWYEIKRLIEKIKENRDMKTRLEINKKDKTREEHIFATKT